jgi:hypothetical protein
MVRFPNICGSHYDKKLSAFRWAEWKNEYEKFNNIRIIKYWLDGFVLAVSFYTSVVQPCRHSPHVATRDLNVATDNCSNMNL